MNQKMKYIIYKDSNVGDTFLIFAPNVDHDTMTRMVGIKKVISAGKLYLQGDTIRPGSVSMGKKFDDRQEKDERLFKVMGILRD